MIDSLIQQNKSFVLYRLPYNKEVHVLIQEEIRSELLYNLEELNGKKAYVIAPFHVSGKHPIVVLKPDAEFVQPIPDGELLSTHYNYDYSEPDKGYKQHFNLFINELTKNRFNKLVLSREKQIEIGKDFSVEVAFYAACRKYIHSYVYVFYTPYTGVWLGCTPEILLSRKDNLWHTMALAGTQLQVDGKLPESWDEKNKIEQRWVATYIKDQLLSYGIEASEKGPYTVPAGKVAHLKSDFYFRLEDESHVGNLLKLLHPTPAVCGLPKEAAKEFILKEEGYDRSYYSGFLGWLDPSGRTELYVNLRCMQIGSDNLTLYAGGGILPSSKLEEEWIETENKLQTILALTRKNVLE